MKNALIFIDTNIFLDFYRVRGRDGKLTILDLVDASHDRIITGEQVEMEFKKNRQKIILDAIKSLKMPDGTGLRVPAFLSEAQPSQMIDKKKGEIRTQTDRIKKRLCRAVEKPWLHDPVYKCLQRLFQTDLEFHLTRTKKIRYSVRAKARKRFMLGCPPRKPEDTSYGDAVNWEWIVHCSSASKRHVIIVSRDRDFGGVLEGRPVLNDWLHYEFKERTTKRRKAVLTDRLTSAFKMAEITVSKEQEAE